MRLFWYVNIKNNFLKLKNIILIYFYTNNTLKNNHNYTPTHAIYYLFCNAFSRIEHQQEPVREELVTELIKCTFNTALGVFKNFEFLF